MRGQPVWAATCLVTSIESLTTAEVARLEPDMRMARWNSWLEPWVGVRVAEARSATWETGERSKRPVRAAPEPWPIIVTLEGSPPKEAIFSWRKENV